MSFAIETRDLTLRFGSFTAVNAVSLQVRKGARHAIIGPNGAGKTSLVHALTGSIPSTSGRVFISGKDMTGSSQRARVRSGLTRTFQINQLFPKLTVLDNVCMAILEREQRSKVFWRSMAAERSVLEEGRDLLELAQLGPQADKVVASLPYGMRRLVEIAIALATRPDIIVLDEPAAGVPTTQSEAIFERIAALPRDLTLLFVEHDMNLVFRFAERITVLAEGAIMTEGTPAEISKDERVREVYLGRGGHHAAA
ncbi:ABC transporter ATP-binding protein [Aquamicrobium lusatiense]|uniref:ABC transporter ATP-binding protein n=1 Tax=Aquamicrobium lusatiense TaxID=89772 RepID=UPI0024579180|nr:ABC transporter ATP-binding protein [Aquamicrobium lusatiense]MDH4989720.1 ABC transporter ATP-binding protein [Aquamicrobium lusatiense]